MSYLVKTAYEYSLQNVCDMDTNAPATCVMEAPLIRLWLFCLLRAL